MKLMRTEDAVGQVLCHDITRIIKGVSKGPVFRKGHVIAPEDIPVLKSVGKEHIYIWEKDDTKYHEDEAAGILRDICMGEGMKASEPREGKIELTAEREGLLRVDVAGLNRVNGLGEMMIAARMGGLPVKPRAISEWEPGLFPWSLKKKRWSGPGRRREKNPSCRYCPLRT